VHKAANRRTVDGWKAIAAYLTAGMPIGVSKAAARNYRANYELPVRGCGIAYRVYAFEDELDAWIERHRGEQKSH
jgi:hypothetical protein